LNQHRDSPFSFAKFKDSDQVFLFIQVSYYTVCPQIPILAEISHRYSPVPPLVEFPDLYGFLPKQRLFFSNMLFYPNNY
jgi:hypothetical protein